MQTLTIFAGLAVLSLMSARAARAQLVTVLHDFDLTIGQPAEPETTFVEVAPGVFVGSYSGGLFSITSSGAFAVFSNFENSTYDIGEPGALAPASNGYFYGVRTEGYPAAIYKITPSGSRNVILNTTLTSPSPLIEASDGEIWGTQGNSDTGYSVFKVPLSGAPLVTVSQSLPGPTLGPLLQASDGNFYGATGSTPAGGQIYKVTPSGEYTTLHTFPLFEGSNGGLMEASNGIIYGTAVEGGGNCYPTAGEIFSISFTGSFRTLYRFENVCAGAGPTAGLLEASDGNLYGTTESLGNYYDGSIFRIAPDGSNFTTVTSFSGENGIAPFTYGAALTQGSDGVFYGTTSGGGTGNGGVVFKLDLSLAPPLPSVKLVQPESAQPGATVQLSGNYLLGLSAVSFNGTPAAFTLVNVNYAYATVPSGATTGPITVTTMNGSHTTRKDFTVE